MKKLMFVLSIPMALLVCLTVSGVTGGCGLLNATDGIKISLPVQEFDFDLNANQARGQLEQALSDQLGGIAVDLSGQNTIPAQIAGQNVPSFSTDFEFELPAQQVDLTDQQDLQRYVQAGKVKSVEIERITYDITSNSLNFDLPSLDLYVDAHGATQITASSDMYAKVPAVGAGVTGEGQVNFTTNGSTILSNYLLGSFQFALLGMTNYTLNVVPGQTGIPQGVMVGKVKIKMTFTVDPI